MRFFLAVLTVGAAGIGYTYLNQTDLHSAEVSTASRPLFDWQSAEDPVSIATEDIAHSSGPSSAVRDTINQTRSEITSTLDEFVRTSNESNLVPNPMDSGPQEIVSQETAPRAISQVQHTSDLPIPVQVPGEDKNESKEATPEPAKSEEQDIAQSPVSAEAPLASTTPVPSSPVSAIPATATPAATPNIPVVTIPAIAAEIPASKSPAKSPVNEAALVTKKSMAAQEPAMEQLSTSARRIAESPQSKRRDREQIQKIVDTGWTQIGKSTTNLPLHVRRYGRDGHRTFIIAGLDGQDLIGVKWNEQLAEVLARQMSLYPANEIQMFRSGNPDGLIKQTFLNAHGVAINRNFPGRHYQIRQDKTAGPGPVSEAETRAIIDVLYSFRPRRVVHLTSTRGPTRVLYNTAAKETAVELERTFKVETQLLDVESVPGSLEDFSNGTLDAAVLTLQLNTDSNWKQAWVKHVPLVLTAVNGHSLEKPVADTDEIAKSADGTRIPEPELAATPPKKVRRGYEELPPPPR